MTHDKKRSDQGCILIKIDVWNIAQQAKIWFCKYLWLQSF